MYCSDLVEPHLNRMKVILFFILINPEKKADIIRILRKRSNTRQCNVTGYPPPDLRQCLAFFRGHRRVGFLWFVLLLGRTKNKTNHPKSSNSHPSATTNKAIHCLKWGCVLSYIHTRQPTNLRPMPINFYGFGRVWWGKTLPAMIEERIYPRSCQHPLYPWCTHAQIPLSPTYPSPSGWLIPALHDQSPTYSWYNYAHYAQYRANPRSVCLISTPGLKWIIQANVMPTDSLMRVQYPKCAYGLYC